MPPIYLSIRENYCPHWSGERPGHPLGWCGFRELAQNLFDAREEFGGAAYIRWGGNTLTFTNEGSVLEHKALLLGYTSKVGNAHMIGQWGEGLKVGVLALLRDGYKINIRTGNESWTPALEEAPQFGNERVLTFHIRKLAGNTYFHGVEVRIQGVNKDIWKEVQRRCLNLPDSRPAPELTISTSLGDLLLDRDGEVYVKGLFVEKSKDLRYGYNFTSGVELDRDRNTVKYWDMRQASGNLLLEAVRTRPELTTTLFGLLEEGKRDVAALEYSGIPAVQPLKENLANQWRTLYGEKTIPVKSMEECRQLERVGYQGRVVKENMIHALDGAIPTTERILREVATSTTKIYSLPELTEEERRTLQRGEGVLQGAGLWTAGYNIVDFRDPLIKGQYLSREKGFYISRSVLSSLSSFLVTYLHEKAHEEAADLTSQHISRVEESFEQLLKGLL